MDLMVSTYRLATPVDIHLPNGTIKTVRYVGDAMINKNIYLKDILLVLGFTHNLIFVAQLIVIQQLSAPSFPHIALYMDKIMTRF